MRRCIESVRLRALRGAVLCILVSASVLVPPRSATTTDYLKFVEDLPLAPGLVEDTSAIVVFDKANGRIVQTRASGPPSPVAVVNFYRQTLPQLGWVPQNTTADTTQLRFVRARELLSMHVVTEGNDVIVRFAITPR